MFALSPGQGLPQIGELALAIVLSAAIGIERELRFKQAGLRTHALVGLGAALFMLISKYGFFDVLSEHVRLDPSRVAAQVVTGIGFIGGGLIFVRRDAVRGLTTAAVVWVTAAIGMACGAGLPVLAIAVTAGHFLVVLGLHVITRRFLPARTSASHLRLVYVDGTGTLRDALVAATRRGFVVTEVAAERAVHGEIPDLGRADGRERAEPGLPGGRTVSVTLGLRGPGSVTDLTAELSELPAVLAVNAGDGVDRD
ncbi:MgtC/SapB family protein [Microtetraspora sp. NBRC 16547]|uniref:MgtC/SapB family protein n=1 Tax=Microtetraspora sp. NBRC 16547 TaxID=3030993 RepID=UPI0024A11F1E|nr:MgtC/SapB family protein [Microtetraspora sp. NBRC 16547]GLX00919.1 membrane protein [Microtetraspora sp. NBRC 16547]